MVKIASHVRHCSVSYHDLSTLSRATDLSLYFVSPTKSWRGSCWPGLTLSSTHGSHSNRLDSDGDDQLYSRLKLTDNMEDCFKRRQKGCGPHGFL
ncbi:unnamed protein product [Clavelina lepadiformis]|uniref:Uncharacterized protein n=1 Tax=Clavelina lepadiformis TaxID=159417 RepID=A0ABP0G1M5_CLALP